MDIWSRQRFVLAEGARAADGGAVFVDIFSGRLLRAPLDRPLAEQTLFTLPVPLGAVAPIQACDRAWIAAAGHGIAIVGSDGEPTWLAQPEAGAQLPMRMNDGACDPAGRFWAGSMAYDATPAAGALYRVDDDGTVTRVLTGISIPNGPAFSRDGTVMYFTDTATRRINAYPVDPATGALGTPRQFARIESGTPDGMSVDGEDHLWVAVFGSGEVHRYDPDGSLDRVLALPARQPTSVTLTPGPSGTRLIVTTASYGLDQPTDEDGAVFMTDVDIPAGPTHPYRPSVTLRASRTPSPTDATVEALHTGQLTGVDLKDRPTFYSGDAA